MDERRHGDTTRIISGPPPVRYLRSGGRGGTSRFAGPSLREGGPSFTAHSPVAAGSTSALRADPSRGREGHNDGNDPGALARASSERLRRTARRTHRSVRAKGRQQQRHRSARGPTSPTTNHYRCPSLPLPPCAFTILSAERPGEGPPLPFANTPSACESCTARGFAHDLQLPPAPHRLLHHCPAAARSQSLQRRTHAPCQPDRLR